MPQSRTPPSSLVKWLARIHIGVNRLSGGRVGNKMQGFEVCFVTMTGAKSGREITKPLMYVPYEDGVLLVASLGGAPRNPAWYWNVLKHPDIEVRHRRQTMDLTARLATAAEKPSLWPICDERFPPYAEYRALTDRDIPIFVCEPRPHR